MTQLRVISLGAGVQSTTLALLAAHGEVGPMPDCAIFADTGWEPKTVYAHLDWLVASGLLPFPVHRVSAGNIREHLTQGGSVRSGRFITIPTFLKGRDGSLGIGRRQCTSHYKVEPIRRRERELLGKRARERIAPGAIEKWIGISVDEIIRATPAKVLFETNRFPLLELRMNRSDCLAWLTRHGYPTPPKSACIGCPFHSNAAWRRLRDEAPEEWNDAVEVDKAVRTPVSRRGAATMKGEQFLHAQRVPLDQVDLGAEGQADLFDHECEGLCGV